MARPLYKEEICNLSQFRKAAGLSQSALAEASGVNRTTIAAIEGRRLNLKSTTKQRIAASLGVAVKQIWPAEDEEWSPPTQFLNTGDIIKAKRIKQGLSRLQLANMAGCTVTVLKPWERSVCLPNAFERYAITRALGLPRAVARVGLPSTPLRGGKRIRHYRLIKRYTPAQLAKEAGLSTKRIQAIEREEEIIFSDKTASQIASVLGIHPDQLLDEQQELL